MPLEQPRLSHKWRLGELGLFSLEKTEQEVLSGHQESTSLLYRWWTSGISCLETLWSLLPHGRSSKAICIRSWASSFMWPCWSTLGFDQTRSNHRGLDSEASRGPLQPQWLQLLWFSLLPYTCIAPLSSGRIFLPSGKEAPSCACLASYTW